MAPRCLFAITDNEVASTTRRHQLESTLRTLKLSGMLDTLEARVAEARAGELGHLEFLQVLCEDEIARRDATAIVRRVRQARFEQPVTLEDFDFSYNPKIPAVDFRDLATLRFVYRQRRQSSSTARSGSARPTSASPRPSGVPARAQRRVHQNQPAPRRSRRRPRRPHLGRPAPTLGQTRRPGPRRLRHARLHRRAKPTTSTSSSPNAHNHGSMILTSNRAPVDWYPLFPNPVVAESVLDRLINTAHHLHLDGRSYRPNKRPGTRSPEQKGAARD